MVVSSRYISENVSKIKIGKSTGPDGICAETLKFAHENLSFLFSLCSPFSPHDYQPSAMTETCIIPIVKNNVAIFL